LQPHERIVASAIYYYDRDDGIEDAGMRVVVLITQVVLTAMPTGLYLRRKRDDEDFPNPENDRRDVRDWLA
jgi:hypothetical protein